MSGLIYADSGIITAVSIQARTIQLNNKVFTLADPLLTLNPDGHLTSQVQLAAGQKIQYWLIDDKIQKIQILKGYDSKKDLPK